MEAWLLNEMNVPGTVLGGGAQGRQLNGCMCRILGGGGFDDRLLNGYMYRVLRGGGFAE